MWLLAVASREGEASTAGAPLGQGRGHLRDRGHGRRSRGDGRELPMGLEAGMAWCPCGMGPVAPPMVSRKHRHLLLTNS